MYRKDSLTEVEKDAIKDVCRKNNVLLHHSRLGVRDDAGFDQMTRIYKAFFVEKRGLCAANRKCYLATTTKTKVTIGDILDGVAGLAGMNKS